ncbi:hypothetical protein GCM10018785_53600 [Streptomyces longispororuber]|uniref:Uncharacterized protein n=1 Tax=Streptomyces longispororuber TaxID=68230 RepID=A0A918ZZM3_9ACTN|nr:hypothetical protein GCM10018785_53600 [Streptomyces longispororuber]
MRAVVRQAVRDVRTAPPPPPADPPADPTVAALRRVADDLAASTHAIGELVLEIAPAYLSDTEAADILALLCDETVGNGLAARRYAMSGDRRALHGHSLTTYGLTDGRAQHLHAEDERGSIMDLSHDAGRRTGKWITGADGWKSAPKACERDSGTGLGCAGALLRRRKRLRRLP